MRVGLELPLDLEPESSVLVVGCGGGFDILAGLPVALRLKALGHRVHLANYCVGAVSQTAGAERVHPGLWRVGPTARDPADNRGFPEGPISRWWTRTFGEEAPVWCLERPGVRPCAAAFAHLKRELSLSAIVIADGGVDGLFKGHEYDTGTPSMDAVSILGAHLVPDLRGYFVVSAFGTEGAAYQVRHAEVLERMAELVREDAMLGVAQLTRRSLVGQQFDSAVEFVHSHFRDTAHSIIVSSIMAGMRGRFGEVSLTPRTDWHPVWISPLQSLYWAFLLAPVARAKPYYDEAVGTDTIEQMAGAIDRARARLGARPKTDIPI